MKKCKLLTLFCVPFLLAGCGSNNVNPPVDPGDDGGAVEPTIPTKTVSELAENEYDKVPLYYLSKLSTYKSYKAVTKGSTTAQVLFIKVDQSIDVTTIKGEDYSYMKNESHSSQVNTSHEVWYHQDRAVYKDNGEQDYHLITMPNYLVKYGTYPFELSMEGYQIGSDAIKKVTKLESSEHHKFKVEFNPEEASKNVKIQMKQFGGLDDYPVIAGVEMTITLKDDFTPLLLELTSQYVAKKIMESSCSQKYTVTYSDYNESVAIPGLEEAKSHFNN